LEIKGSEPLPSPPPDTRLESGMKLVLIGNPHQEEEFTLKFGNKRGAKS